MFEKVGAATSARPQWLRPGCLGMAAAAHVVFAAGIASVPRPRIDPPRSVEVATFLIPVSYTHLTLPTNSRV